MTSIFLDSGREREPRVLLLSPGECTQESVFEVGELARHCDGPGLQPLGVAAPVPRVGVMGAVSAWAGRLKDL